MISNRNKYLAKNTAVFIIGNIGTKLINFLMVPLYTYSLSTEQYGTVDLITTLVMMLAPILILNVNESILRYSLDQERNKNEILSIGIVSIVFAFVLALFPTWIIYRIEAMKEYALCFYFYMISLSISQVFSCYIRGLEKLKEYATASLISTFVVASLCVVFLVHYNLGIRGYFLAYILGISVSNTYLFVKGEIWKGFSNFTLNRSLARDMLRYSVVLIPNTFMWWIINSSDRMMITAMMGTAANGIYAVSYKLPSSMQTLTQVFNQAWSYSAIRESKSEDNDAYNTRIYNFITSATAIIGIIVITFIRPIMRLYVSTEYYTAWTYTPFLVVGFVFLSAASFIGTQYTVHKYSIGYLLSSTCGAIVNIILNFFLIPKIGINGAALATCISYISVYVYRIIDTRKFVKIQYGDTRRVSTITILLLTSLLCLMDCKIGNCLMIANLVIVLILYKNPLCQLLHRIFYLIGNQ